MNLGKKKGLGRGLSALFGDESPKEKTTTNQNNMVAIADLSRNPYQPRQNFKEEKLEELKKESIDNRDITNINFLPFLEKNSQVNQYLNSIDIDLGGMSGAEGWNLPSFNATCLGAWSIVLNATAHKDWATKDNCILIEPSGKTDIFDGRFFKGEEFNIGCKYDFNDQDFIQAMHIAVDKVKNNIKNTKGQELKDKFTYKKTLENILKHF